MAPQAMRNMQQPQQNVTTSSVVPSADPLGNIVGKMQSQVSALLNDKDFLDRFARMALTELRINKKLGDAVASNPVSFYGAMNKVAALGLQVGNGLGHAYLLPFDKKQKQGNQWVTVATEIQLIIGYQGMIELARRSGQIESLYAVPVYKGEPFEVTMGLSQDIQHKKIFDGSVDPTPQNLIAVYAVAKLKGGAVQFDVMTLKEIDNIRSRSKSKDNGPWVTDYVEMAKKTVLRRLFKMLPVSVEVKAKDGSKVVTDRVTLANVQDDDASIVVDQDGVILNHESESQSSLQPSDSYLNFRSQVQKVESLEALEELALQASNMLEEDELNMINAEVQMRKQELGSLV